MGGGSAGLVRWLGSLYEHGAIGGLSDARLVERFTSREGTDREDAFSALVYRHGPMVLRVCQRMLSDPADADDAFQAVFLVLARKADSLRRAEDLKSWLYGVAVRTSLEARKRSAKLRAREGTPLDDSLAAIARDEPIELRALLDEELNKLPNRFREPLLLCELEGVSRQEAARRLGLPEGTLSSRLARGRSLLRDRLTRRGVAVGTLGTIFPAPAKAAATLDASLRLALKFAARDAVAGTVPAAVASLAEGVIPMFQAAKLKSVLLATSTLIVACLTAGLVAGRASPPAAAPPKVVAQAAEPLKKEPGRELVRLRGVVVDESGKPVAGAEVRYYAYSPRESVAVTGPDGAFVIPVHPNAIGARPILARADGGRKLGVFRYGFNLTRAKAEEPVEIVVKPSREITVHVADADKAPIEDAVVEVAEGSYIVAHATTGADGAAKVFVPIDSKVSWIIAQKVATGFDYAELGKFNETGGMSEGAAAEELPDSVALTLESPRVARIQAVNPDGEPLAGVDLRVWLLNKEGRRSEVNYFSRIQVATTDADGVATFDWLPRSKDTLTLLPLDDQFADRRIFIKEDEGETAPAVATLFRAETIRGRLALPDGSPAWDIEVFALGTGQGLDQGRGAARTDDEGRYEMRVPPNEAYAIWVEDEDWAASSRLDVVVRAGKPVPSVDFQLAQGTVIKGIVTVGEDNRPAAGESIFLNEMGGEPPEDIHEEGDQVSRVVRRWVSSRTDAEGRYAIRVGPGTYTLEGPSRTQSATITVTDQPEVVHDFHMVRPEKGGLWGRVVSGADEKPVAGARVDIHSAERMGIRLAAKTDDQGRFHVGRYLDKSFLCAWSPDGSLGALIEIGPDESNIVVPLTPTASASGLLLDEHGEPAANQPIDWGRRIYIGEDGRGHITAFAFDKVVTDDEGRFTLPALVVGQRYDISVKRDRFYHPVGVAAPQKPGPMDLGAIVVGDYPSDPTRPVPPSTGASSKSE